LYDQYTLSLDWLVTRAYHRISNTTHILVVLLVVEAGALGLMCLLYNYLLVKASNRAHMVAFTVLLSFPSALIRTMASKPLQVDGVPLLLITAGGRLYFNLLNLSIYCFGSALFVNELRCLTKYGKVQSSRGGIDPSCNPCNA
jgi:uncharacterized membrane protein